MTWLTATYAIVAASIAVPALVILYFLKLRRRDMEVSTTLLWKKAIQDLQANAPFQKLRRNILLILQLLVLAAAISAIGQPQFKGEATAGRRHIILIDRSASMSASDGDSESTRGVTRLEAAKRAAGDLVDSLREPGLFAKDSADQAMVIAFDTTAEVRQQFTTDKAALKAALDAISPTDAPTLVGEAMRLAKAYAPRRILEGKEVEGLEQGEPAEIHLFSDGRLPDAAENKPGTNDVVVYHRTGEPTAGNIAIRDLRSERQYDQPSRLSVYVGLQSTMRQERRVDVELRIDGVVAGIRPVTVDGAKLANEPLPGAEPREAPQGGSTDDESKAQKGPRLTPGTGGVVFELERAEAGVVEVRLLGLDPTPGAKFSPTDDILSTDNRSWLVVPPAKRLAVAIVTRGNLFISAALGGLPLSKRDTFSPEDYEKAIKDGKAAEYDVVVLDGWLPPAGPAGGLPPGRYVVLDEVPTNAGVIDKGKGEQGYFVDWTRSHPVMRGLNLDGVNIAAPRRLEIVQRSSDSAEPLAKGSDSKGDGKSATEPNKANAGYGAAVSLASTPEGPAILEMSGADWRAVVVSFNVAASDWPFQASFVVFMATAVDYIGGGRSAAAQQTVQPGGVISSRLPGAVEDAQVRLPDGKVESLVVAGDGRVVYGPIRTGGVYEVSWKGPGGFADQSRDGRAIRPFAAGLLDGAESDIAAAEQLELSDRRVGGSAARSRTLTKLWPWLLLAALAVVMLEWFVYNRKVHV